MLFRILLFRFFNRISTWRLLQSALGELTWAAFRLDRYDEVLSEAFSRRERIYPPPISFLPEVGCAAQTRNHLLLQQMLRSGLRNKLQRCASMAEAFQLLRGYPGMGDLAYQLLIDINYSTVINFDEMDFVVPGPGAETDSTSASALQPGVSKQTSSGT